MGDNLYSCPAMLLRNHIVLLKGGRCSYGSEYSQLHSCHFLFFRQSVAPGFRHDVFMRIFSEYHIWKKSQKNLKKKNIINKFSQRRSRLFLWLLWRSVNVQVGRWKRLLPSKMWQSEYQTTSFGNGDDRPLISGFPLTCTCAPCYSASLVPPPTDWTSVVYPLQSNIVFSFYRELTINWPHVELETRLVTHPERMFFFFSLAPP